jgi:hypothetical protein
LAPINIIYLVLYRNSDFSLLVEAQTQDTFLIKDFK